MIKFMIKALVFSIFLGWVTSNFAQDYHSKISKFEFAGQDNVKPVTIRDRLLWGSGALLNLPKKEGPIPLYSYPISQLPEDITLEVLSLAAVGKVHVAILTFSDTNNKSDARALGLRVLGDWSSVSQEEWKNFQNENSEYFGEKEQIDIAFTRPLALKKIDHLTAEEREALEKERHKFVTSMDLWGKAEN